VCCHQGGGAFQAPLGWTAPVMACGGAMSAASSMMAPTTSPPVPPFSRRASRSQSRWGLIKPHAGRTAPARAGSPAAWASHRCKACPRGARGEGGARPQEGAGKDLGFVVIVLTRTVLGQQHIRHIRSLAFEQQVAPGARLNLSNGGEGKGSRDNIATHNMLIKCDNI
jgi:hypothetical protein